MNFRVYRSSAGSGKTFTLVTEYLAIVIADPQKYRNILAVTFTNKAANEMKERILKRLKELAAGDSGKDTAVMLPQLICKTGLSEEVIRKNAAEVLSFILHRYTDFAVSTIDSFTHRIIRSFAYDLHLPQNFEVEMQPEKFIAEAVDLLISKAGSEDALTHALVEFTETKAQEEKNWNIENDLALFARSLLNEDTQQYIGRLKHLRVADFIKIKNKITARRIIFEKSVKEIGNDALALISNAGLKADYFYQGKNGIVKYFEYLRDCRADKFTPGSYVTATIEDEKWYSGKAGNSEKTAIDGIRDELVSLYGRSRSIIDAGLDNYIVYSLIIRNIFPLAVLNETALLLDELKSENNIIFISEFNQRIAEVVLKEPVPFIYERAGERYRNFLLDEFQDTSVMQWHNLLPLIDNSLSDGNFNLVVGDGKQAIYRWRNGDVEQFERLPEIIRKRSPMAVEHENALKRNFETVMLDTNYRSLQNIVEFNNGLFNFIREHLTGTAAEIYSHVSQKMLPLKTGGYVELQFIPAPPDEELSFTQHQLIAAESIIQSVTKDNYSYKDITIICRENRNASEMARYLISRGIPVISSESLLLSASADIHFMLSLLRWISNNRDDLARTAVLSWIIHNGKAGNTSLEELLNQLREGSAFASILRSLDIDLPFAKLVKEPVYELCEELMRIFDLSAKTDPYLAFFMDAVFEYSGNYNGSPAGFLEWWEQNGSRRSVKVPEGTNAVQVMTIHRSKGLEFPVVIYAFASESVRNTMNSVWVEMHDEHLEELPVAMLPLSKTLLQTRFAGLYEQEKERSYLDFINVLYVVLTRPVDRLYVLSGSPSGDTGGLLSVPDILSAWLVSLGRWNEMERIYSFGEKTSGSQPAQNEMPAAFPKISTAGWKGRAVLRSRATFPDAEVADKKTYGMAVHSVLSQINSFDDISMAVSNVLASGLLNTDECEKLTQYLKRLAEVPDIAAFFDNKLGIKAECEIIDSNGKSYRPDRVLIDDGRTVVIDFKTGSENDSHRQQLEKYALLLAEMGYPAIEMYLLYLHDPPLLIRIVS